MDGNEANAALIAHAPRDLAELIAEVEALSLRLAHAGLYDSQEPDADRWTAMQRSLIHFAPATGGG